MHYILLERGIADVYKSVTALFLCLVEEILSHFEFAAILYSISIQSSEFSCSFDTHLKYNLE